MIPEPEALDWVRRGAKRLGDMLPNVVTWGEYARLLERLRERGGIRHPEKTPPQSSNNAPRTNGPTGRDFKRFLERNTGLEPATFSLGICT